MKKLIFLLLLINGMKSVWAQAPQGFTYQAAVRNASGQALVNANIKVRFSILDSMANGPIVFKETHQTQTNTIGIFNLNVGMGSAILGSLSQINWGTNAKFLQVEIDTTASGNNYILIGMQQLMSVPYALFAGNTNSNATPNQNYNLNPSTDSILTLVGGKILETGAYTVPANEHWKIVSIYGSPNFGSGTNYSWKFGSGVMLNSNTCSCRYFTPIFDLIKIKQDLYNAPITSNTNYYQSIQIQATSTSACPSTAIFPASFTYDLRQIQMPVWLSPNETLELFSEIRVSIEIYK